MQLSTDFYCCFIACLFWHKTLTAALLEAAITPPLIYNAYLDSREYGTFTCVTRNSDAVHWLVDGVLDILPSVINTRLIRVNSIGLGHSMITIPAIPVNQHITEIKCIAYQLDESFQEEEKQESMETAQFHIQGLLDMQPNITYANYNVTHNLVEWLEPKTLNITRIEPDIESYTICMNITDECVNTTATSTVFPKYFVDILVYVTAWNIVGESNNSAQLAIEACSTTLVAGQRYHVEIAFEEKNLTLLHITFMDDKAKNNDSLWTATSEECLYLYEVKILHRNTRSALSTQQLYDDRHTIMLRLQLPKNQLYTIVVKRITSSTELSLNSVDFSTYDVQDLRVRFDSELNSLQITYHLAAGAKTEGFTLRLMRENHTLLQTSFNISNTCGQVPFLQSCAVNNSIKLPQQGNFTLFVLGWEQNQGIISDYVYFQEFIIENSSATDTTPSRSTNIDYNITETTHAQSALLIISVATTGSCVLGVGTVCLICLLVVVVISKRIKYKDGDNSLNATNPQVTPNEAYSVSLQMKENEAYETTLKEQISNNEPHLYDEIDLLRVVSNRDPVYAEIAGQAPKHL